MEHLCFPCAVFLYLNQNTFVGELGQQLAEDVRHVRDRGIEIVLIHENDPERGGCFFERSAQPCHVILQVALA